jgi:hypothetical protein
MAPPQTPQVSLAELSRCDDRSWLPVEEQNVDHKAEKADAYIAEKVDRALWNTGMLRSADYREIDVPPDQYFDTKWGYRINGRTRSGERIKRCV